MVNSVRAVIDRKTAVCSCPFCIYRTFGQKVQKQKGEKDGKEKSKNNALCGGSDDSCRERNRLCMESREEEENGGGQNGCV